MSCMGLMGKIDRITIWKAMQPFHSTWQASKKANVRQTSGDTIGKNMEQCVSLSSYRNTLHPEKATHLGKRRVPRSGDRRTSEQVLWGHAFNTERRWRPDKGRGLEQCKKHDDVSAWDATLNRETRTRQIRMYLHEWLKWRSASCALCSDMDGQENGLILDFQVRMQCAPRHCSARVWGLRLT